MGCETAAKGLLLDTNVWLDYYVPWRDGNRNAFDLIALANEKGWNLLFSIATSKDVFYLVECSFKRQFRLRSSGVLAPDQAAAAREIAWGCLSHMNEIATAVGADESDVWLARKWKNLHADYEDNLQLAAASRANATLFVTEDEQLVKHSPIATLGVSDALRHLAEG